MGTGVPTDRRRLRGLTGVPTTCPDWLVDFKCGDNWSRNGAVSWGRRGDPEKCTGKRGACTQSDCCVPGTYNKKTDIYHCPTDYYHKYTDDLEFVGCIHETQVKKKSIKQIWGYK